MRLILTKYRFTDEADQQRALIEMHGLYCLSRPSKCLRFEYSAYIQLCFDFQCVSLLQRRNLKHHRCLLLTSLKCSSHPMSPPVAPKSLLLSQFPFQQLLKLRACRYPLPPLDPILPSIATLNRIPDHLLGGPIPATH